MAKEKDSALRAEEAIDDAAEVRVYELGFHLDPELPAEEAKKAYQGIRSQITDCGTIVAEGEPEKIQLAYTISRQETSGRRDFDSAYFCWIAYEADVERHAEIVAAAGANKRIIRFIDLVTTKEAARHALETLELAAKTEKEKRAPEAALDAELDAALESAVA